MSGSTYNSGGQSVVDDLNVWCYFSIFTVYLIFVLKKRLEEETQGGKTLFFIAIPTAAAAIAIKVSGREMGKSPSEPSSLSGLHCNQG